MTKKLPKTQNDDVTRCLPVASFGKGGIFRHGLPRLLLFVLLWLGFLQKQNQSSLMSGQQSEPEHRRESQSPQNKNQKNENRRFVSTTRSPGLDPSEWFIHFLFATK